jgi:hypothetical protein
MGDNKKFSQLEIWDDIYFNTVCNRVYLDTAITLMQSVRTYHPGCKFVIGLAETDQWVAENPWVHDLGFDAVISGSNLHPKYETLSQKYDITQLCCAVKANLMKETLALSPRGIAIFMDPDTYAYSALSEVVKALEDGHDIVLTPHLLKGIDAEMEMSSTRHGIFNLGFLGVANTESCISFLDWWDSRLQEYSTDNPMRGYFNDQTWASLGVGFTDAFVLRHAGYNFATWTLRTSILKQDAGSLSVDGHPLRFIHFSGYKSGGLKNTIAKWEVTNSQSAFCEILESYEKHVSEVNLELQARKVSIEIKDISAQMQIDNLSRRVRLAIPLKSKISVFIYQASPKLHRFLKRVIS